MVVVAVIRMPIAYRTAIAGTIIVVFNDNAAAAASHPACTATSEQYGQRGQARSEEQMFRPGFHRQRRPPGPPQK